LGTSKKDLFLIGEQARQRRPTTVSHSILYKKLETWQLQHTYI
jgi:hypothetical protein